jgi:glutathione S-transferase
MMKLLYTNTSPYARKVRIVALEKHIALELQIVVLADANCVVKNFNPLAKVPVLVLDDNSSLYDSRVIVEFLDNHTPSAQLIPQDNTLKIAVRQWEALADGITDAAVAAMIEGRKATERQSADYIEKQLDKVKRGLEVMNVDINKRKWCVNETFSLADIAVGCTLAYIDLRFKSLNWQDNYPNLTKHYNILSKRPSFKQTMPVI